MLTVGLRALLVLVAAPLAAGLLAVWPTGKKQWVRGAAPQLALAYLTGQLICWASFQVLAVPLVFAHAPFHAAVIGHGLLMLLVLAALALRAAQKRRRARGGEQKARGTHAEGSRPPAPRALRRAWRRWTPLDALLLALILFVIAFTCGRYVTQMHIDQDDSRFITNAVDAWEGDSMLDTDPITGDPAPDWIGERGKDVTSPWSLYLAELAHLLHLHPAIVAHTVYAPFLLFTAYAALYLVGSLLFLQRRERLLFLLSAMGIQLFFAGTTRSAAEFALVRIWQGKAVVAAIGAPAFLLLLLLLKRNGQREGNGVHLGLFPVLLSLSCCLFSGVGIVTAGMLTGGLFVWASLMYDRWQNRLAIWLAILPPAVYGLTYVMLLRP